MKPRLIALSIMYVAATAMRSPAQTPLGTDFTYQGQLKRAGMPAVSTADIQFSLFDAVTGGSQVGSTVSKANVHIVNGLFTLALDFGASALNGDARWIQIAVRSPAGSGGFATLDPRQPITAAPYARYAKYSETTRGISVDANERVGIGTATPGKKLTVAGDMELGTSAGDYRHFRIGGGNSSGFIYGSYPALGDGIHMGYNYFADAAGAGQIITPDTRTSRISMGYGTIALATGGTIQAPMDRLFVNASGNVGIGTQDPAAKLDVRGNIRLGSIGQLFAAGGDENLRIIRGNIDGTGATDAGSGFTCVRYPCCDGRYQITFTTPFNGTPSMTLTPNISFSGGGPDQPRWPHIVSINSSQADVWMVDDTFDYTTNSKFSFCAIGPR